MEGSESEAILDSLKLNPQLFINEVLNCVDDLVHDAFSFFHQEASTLLKIEGTDRSNDLNKGVACVRNMVQSALDKRLSMWEKYCLRHCFVVPQGFSLPNSDKPSGDIQSDLDAVGDSELDAQLDSLRDKLNLVGQECADLNRELQALERQAALSNRTSGLVNEALQLYEQQSVNEMFQELITTSLEFRAKVEKLKTTRAEEMQCLLNKRICISNGDMFKTTHGNGLFNANLEELQEFWDDLKIVN